jgi:hypothetical protein
MLSMLRLTRITNIIESHRFLWPVVPEACHRNKHLDLTSPVVHMQVEGRHQVELLSLKQSD